jgi:Na+/phosphate symporter
MSQIDVATKSGTKRRASGLKASVEDFVKAFEWTWTNAVLFSLALTFFILISTAIMPSFWMYYAEQKIGWAGPTDIEAFLRHPFGTSITDPLSSYGYVMVRDAIAMGLTTLPFVLILVVSAAMQNWRKKLRGGESGARASGGYR